MKRPRTIPRVGSVLVLAAFTVAAGIAEPGYCQDRPLPGPGAKALSTDPGWSPTGNLNTARCGHTATLLASGKVLVVGGSNGRDCSSINPNTLDSAELYDPVTGSWSVTGSLKQPRTNHTATLLPSGLVLVVGGEVASATSSDTISTAELYDPDAGDWKSTGNLIAQRSYHTATLLQNGNVLVAGGFGGSGSLDSAELYDPSTGTWSRTGNLVTGRYWHTATQLQNGKVLVAGGLLYVAPNGGQIEASAELYDPVSGAWTRTGDLNGVHSQHTATQMQDGKVLVASGDDPYDDYDQANGTAEIYDPGTATWSNTGSLRVIRTVTLQRCCRAAKFWSLEVSTFPPRTAQSCTIRYPALGPPRVTSAHRATSGTQQRSFPMGRSWLRLARARPALRPLSTARSFMLMELRRRQACR
jgi:hypothetical protein